MFHDWGVDFKISPMDRPWFPLFCLGLEQQLAHFFTRKNGVPFTAVDLRDKTSLIATQIPTGIMERWFVFGIQFTFDKADFLLIQTTYKNADSGRQWFVTDDALTWVDEVKILEHHDGNGRPCVSVSASLELPYSYISLGDTPGADERLRRFRIRFPCPEETVYAVYNDAVI